MPSYLPSYAFLTAVLCISILPKTVIATGSIIEIPYYSKQHPFLMAIFHPKVLTAYKL
jgi:hypothetical protein